MIRVGFALGSWQLVTLAAALDQSRAAAGSDSAYDDHLVLYETGPVSDELKAAMREVAAAVRPWRRVVEAFDLLADVPRKPGRRELDEWTVRLRERLALTHIDELWLCWLTRPAEKLILEAYPTARVLLYEDGLTSYLAPASAPVKSKSAVVPWPAPIRAWWRAREPAWRFRRHRSRLDPRHAERVAGAWMVLADVWPAPAPLAKVPWHAVLSATLASTLAACQRLSSVAAFAAPRRARPALLVLGQSLSRWGVMTRAEELAVYERAVALALDRGYDVWWKEHPRVQQPFFAELAHGVPAGRLCQLELPFALPVELVAERLGLAGCIAGISAALFYLARQYGIPGFTFADDLAPFLRGAWAMQNEMVRRRVPSVRSLPPAGAGAAVMPAARPASP